MLHDWQEYRKTIKLDGRHWINGKRVESIDGTTIDKESPIDGKHLVTFSRGKSQDIELAVSFADNIFNSGVWSDLAPSKRKEILLNYAKILEEHARELALLETIDMGKPITESLNFDVAASVECFRWYAEAIDKMYGEVAPTDKDTLAYITRKAVGVVGVIIPWNYPLLMMAWKLAPALATGNSVVLKPSERAPLTALRIGELASLAGIPDGVLNVVAGYGHEAGSALALHNKVRALGFTGSTETGKKMFHYSSMSNLKHVYNELGGKSAVLVFNDCSNLERAADMITKVMFYNHGQSCNAPSRVLVSHDIADKFVNLLIACAKKYQPSNSLLESTIMGSMVDKQQMEVVLSFIKSGIAAGAKCVIGGKQALQNTGGYYVEPTIFDMVTPDMDIATKEIFGPVLSVIRFKDEAHAIALANDSEYGLQAGLWSDDVNRVHRVARQIQAGTVHVNQYGADDITAPFGGVKQSGNGRDKSLHALEKYTELKTVWLHIEN